LNSLSIGGEKSIATDSTVGIFSFNNFINLPFPVPKSRILLVFFGMNSYNKSSPSDL
jgi:hypothetical protein